MGKILVVGIGNLLLMDEGIGVHVVRRLEEAGLPPGVEAIDGGTNSYDLVDIFCQADDIIIVDALKGGHTPGTIYRAPLSELGLKPEENGVSLHQMHFIEAMNMVNLMGCHPRAVVFGVEPHTIDWGLDLSPQVEEKMPRVLELVREEIEKLM